MFLLGYNVSRNVPLTETLPLMVFDTNTTSWTNTIRPTLDAETTYVSDMTRAAIIIGTVIFAVVLMVIALSTHLLRKWNQRNYIKGYENVELEEQRRRAAQELPSILKKRYLSEGGNSANGTSGSNRSGRGVGNQSEVLFEDEEGDYSDENGSFDGDDEYEDDQHGGQKVSLLSRPQPNPKSRSLQDQQQQGLAPPPQRERRVRIQELVEEEDEEGGSEYGTLGEDDDDDDDDDGSAVIVRLPPDLSEREE